MSGVEDAYAGLVREGLLEPDPEQAAAAMRLGALEEALGRWKPRALFGSGPAPLGLYLWGGVGRGKSMLMDLFFEHAPVARKQRTHFHSFMRARHAFMREERERRHNGGQDALIAAAAKDVAARADLLCFDEFAVTDIADAMILGRLFERLFAANVVVVATSNRAPDDLYKNGINRQLFLPFIDLLKQSLDVVELAAARDYRLERLRAGPVWFSPLGPAASEAMEAAWRRLTHGARPQPMTLTVLDRELPVARAAACCAWMTFEELCARPLGASDYLELADSFDTLLIENIPKMTPAMREEAARFRTLIDILYEGRVKLVASADAEPHALYPEGDQSFEFERTASRLMEMRSAEYLAARRRDREFRDALRDT